MAGLSHTSSHPCAMCVAQPPKFIRATAFGLYDDLRSAIHLMKFAGVPSLAKPLGILLAAAIAKHRVEFPDNLMVLPVPLFRGKRSFNQSTLLARSALASLKRSAPDLRLTFRTDLLHRLRRTESQFLLTPAQRKDNVRGAFKASSKVHGLHILLVDDVYTTGATVTECTRVLHAAGAKSVRVATLARAGRDFAVPWRPTINIPAVQIQADPAQHAKKNWIQLRQ